MDPTIVAVSVGPDSRWRIITRPGQMLVESTDTFETLLDALTDGREHPRGVTGEHSTEEGQPRSTGLDAHLRLN